MLKNSPLRPDSGSAALVGVQCGEGAGLCCVHVYFSRLGWWSVPARAMCMEDAETRRRDWASHFHVHLN